ncbi:3-methyl-2-oxobutanoate hydroxymethyltransferase [Anaeromyxobacter diazotrophicus]|uniref:3-methyl-2-oxobutanoate hydroxymethyltransferase n=1 Tax=Anaeromyxobacter diazotrophicus TaxID=2590199 RepID=A0A7I9VL76_9BACT|nr:3-methyl-2-oxobutanoate hydroxymethyltransferase [Anaeromyxobacter diazotrophicus]GEJ56859.1 3-methyl-2-oxobutanoate hydroxymethyltransferase [Anaeromyxobacter diazotrophicus]
MSTQPQAPRRRLTITDLRKMKVAGEKIAMVTAYDAAMARLVDEGGADAVLVGDSLGMVFQGHDSTLPVALEHMIYHAAAVRRGLARSAGRAHLTVDMPFGSYQAGADDAVRSAMRLAAEGGAEAVKLEGGADYADVIRRIVRAGVPVMGHIGLTPQSVHRMGGYVVQGKDSEKARRLLDDARAVEAAGCSAIVLECIPAELARVITGELSIPTIGIGAGPHCDGQVLVVNDLLGLDGAFKPKFVKRYAEQGASTAGAVSAYAAEVKQGSFPAEEHSFHSKTLRLVHASEEERPDDAQVVGAPV